MKLKSILSLVMILVFNTFVNAQNVYENFQDGKIWIQLKDTELLNETVNRTGEVDPNVLENYSFVNSLKGQYAINSLSRPFSKATGRGSAPLVRTFLIEFDNHSSVENLINDLMSSGKLLYAEKVPLDKTSLTPNDPLFGSEWGLTQIQAELAWNVSVGSASVIVATVDNAIQINHADLSAQIWVNPGEIASNGIDDDGNGYVDDVNGWDVGNNDNNPNPLNTSWDHGTHVAGTTGATTNNGTGVASIGFGITIMPVKATSNSASPNAVTNGYDGIYYAALNGAHVINCSWGGYGYSSTGQNVVNWAWNQGSIVVAAAGNDNLNMDSGGNAHYPSNYNNVVCVASSTTGDVKSSFSNYGSAVDVTAPGSSIRSTVPFGNYAYMSGTSMASPLVSGLLGLMISANPGLPQQDYVDCLISSCDNINGPNPSYIGDLGGGRVNALTSVNCVVASLNNPPVADFSANFTTITAGGTVQFTDLSVYTPTTWAWNFDNLGVGGVTPATAGTQGPHNVTYNTPGVFEVSLTVTNVNGGDSEVKTAYINVVAAGACNTLNLDDPNFSSLASIHVGWTPTEYGAGPGNGFVAGNNIYGDEAKAEYFPSAMVGSSGFVTGTYVWFGTAYSGNPNKTISINVYDATGGIPSTVLGSEIVTMGDIDGGGIYYFAFDPPVAVPVSQEIAVGVDFSNLVWAGPDNDSLSIVTNNVAESGTSEGWEKWNNNNWYDYPSGWGAGNDWNHYIFPDLTSNPPIANITTSPLTICEGETVDFDATGSTYEDTLIWTFVGTSPASSSNITESVVYNTSGTYKAYLQVIGGGCANYAIDSVTITVNPNPNVIVTASDDEICLGDGPVTITATGAGSYLWSPGGQTSAAIVVNPTMTTTYSVAGTTAGCTGESTIQIIVGQFPVLAANITNVDCFGASTGAIDLTVSASSGNETFNWGVQGTNEDLSGIPAGTYPVTVTSEQGCVTNDSYIVTQPASPLTVTETITDASCGLSDGTVTLNMSGGTPGYTEDWGAANPSALPGGSHPYTVTDANGCVWNGSAIVTNPSAPTVTLNSSTNVTCFGGTDGTATINITGGTPGYTENWGAQNPVALPAGTHSVQVTDMANCVGSLNIVISQPAAITTSPAVTQVDCNGASTGVVVLNTAGGTPGYTEDWGANNPIALAAGSYSVNITDANGCTSNANVTVTEPTAISANSSINTPSCNGDMDGVVTLTISGGTPAYTEDWGTDDPNAIGAGTYNPTITDANGCVFVLPVTVTEPALITTAPVVTDVSCFGANDGAVALNVAGGTPTYTADWGGNNPNLLGPGTYNPTITDANGCTGSATVTVTEPPALAISAVITNENAGTGSDGAIDITVTGGIPPYTFLWSNGATTEDIAGLDSGTYTVTVTDANGCTINDSYYVNFSNVGISPWEAKGFKLYPNPANEQVTIQLAGNFIYELRNDLGQIIYSGNGTDIELIEVSNLSDGIYFIRILQDQESLDVKFVKL